MKKYSKFIMKNKTSKILERLKIKILMKQIFYDNIVVGSGISALGIIHGLIKKKKE